MTNPRLNLEDAVEYAAGDLPDGFEIILSIELGSASLELLSPAGGSEDFHVDPELGIADAICNAVEKANEY